MWLSSIPSALVLEPTRYPWRGLHLVPTDEASAMYNLAGDLMRCNAAQVLHELGRPEHEELLGEVPADFVLHDGLQAFALELHLAGFERYAFRHAIRRMLAIVRVPPASHRAYASYLDVPPETMSAADAARLWDAHETFLADWLGSAPFKELFLLPKKQPLDTTNVDRPSYVQMLGALAQVSVLARELAGDPAAIRLLRFWLRRVRQASFWPEDGGLVPSLRAFCAAEADYHDPFFTDSDGVDMMVDYSSTFTPRLVAESATELYFPVSGLRIPPVPREERRRWVAQEFYDRIDHASFGVKGDVKGGRVVTAARELLAREMADVDEPMKLFTSDEIVETQRYLTGFVRKHFLGYIAELVGIPLLIRALGHTFPAGSTCIPGTAMRVVERGHLAQGPDGIVGSIEERGGRFHLTVHALLEVKGYSKQREPLIEQLDKHRRRIAAGSVRVRCSEPGAAGRWVTWPTATSTSERKRAEVEVEISSCEVPDDVRYIAIVPGRTNGRDQSAGHFTELQLPWSARGIGELSRAFLFSILRQCGFASDPDDEDLGRRAWAAIVAPLVNDKSLTPEDRSSMRHVIDHRLEPDVYVLPRILERRSARRMRPGSAPVIFRSATPAYR